MKNKLKGLKYRTPDGDTITINKVKKEIIVFKEVVKVSEDGNTWWVFDYRSVLVPGMVEQIENAPYTPSMTWPEISRAIKKAIKKS